MRHPLLGSAVIVALCLGLGSCKPDPTVRYENAPNAADPLLKVLTFNVTPNSGSLVPKETDADGTVTGSPNDELLIWGRADHPAGIKTMKMTLLHDNSVANVASFTQPAAIGSSVTNPVTIYGSDGLGGVGALRPFTFKLTDEKYSVVLTAADAAGHTRTITVKYTYYRGSGGSGGSGGFPTGGGTSSGGTSSGGNTSTGPTCTCPDPNNPDNPICGGKYGATCTTDAQCAPGLRCGTDPNGPPGRNSCVKIENGCPPVTCWKPADLSYDRTQCFAPVK